MIQPTEKQIFEVVKKAIFEIHEDLEDPGFDPQIESENLSNEIYALFEDRDIDDNNSADRKMLSYVASMHKCDLINLVCLYARIRRQNEAFPGDIAQLAQMGIPVFPKLVRINGYSPKAPKVVSFQTIERILRKTIMHRY